MPVTTTSLPVVLENKVDNTSIEVSSGLLQIKDDGVGKAKLNADVVGIATATGKVNTINSTNFTNLDGANFTNLPEQLHNMLYSFLNDEYVSSNTDGTFIYEDKQFKLTGDGGGADNLSIFWTNCPVTGYGTYQWTAKFTDGGGGSETHLAYCATEHTYTANMFEFMYHGTSDVSKVKSADGVDVESTDTTGDLTTDFQNLKLIYSAASVIFYIAGSLEATHSTRHPTTATTLRQNWAVLIADVLEINDFRVVA